MTLHEVKHVEAGKFYIVTGIRRNDDEGPLFVSILADRFEGKVLMFRTSPDWIARVEDALRNGARFYGPIELQPAQDGAGESEAG